MANEPQNKEGGAEMTVLEYVAAGLFWLSIMSFCFGVGRQTFNILSRIRLDSEIFFVLAFFCMFSAYALQCLAASHLKEDCQKQAEQVSAVKNEADEPRFEIEKDIAGDSYDFQVFIPEQEFPERIRCKFARGVSVPSYDQLLPCRRSNKIFDEFGTREGYIHYYY